LGKEDQYLKFKLKTKEAELDFEGDRLSSGQVSSIINQIIKPNFQNNSHLEKTSANNDLINRVIRSENSPKELKVNKNINFNPEKFTNASKELAKEFTRPKQLPRVGEENRGSNTIGELLGDTLQKISPTKVESDAEPDFYHTGIKYKNGKPSYRTYYSCPRCNHSGRHYIPPNVTAVSCHECQSKLIVEPSTKHGFGNAEKNRDASGNYFVAHTLEIDNTPLYERGEY
jgi:hypothetical protein